MSQSDYLRRKRVSNVLNMDASGIPIYGAKEYTDFKQYQLENEIKSTNLNNQQILPTNRQYILDMERNVTNCPIFVLCADAYKRPNKLPHTGAMCSILPLNWYEKKTKAYTDYITCKCNT